MTPSTRAFFVFLVALILVATLLGFAGVARLHRLRQPPFDQNEMSGMFATVSSPPDGLVLFMDSTWGALVVWTMALVVPTACGVLVFGFRRWLPGFAVLLACAALFLWMGLRIWLHAMIDPVL